LRPLEGLGILTSLVTVPNRPKTSRALTHQKDHSFLVYSRGVISLVRVDPNSIRVTHLAEVGSPGSDDCKAFRVSQACTCELGKSTLGDDSSTPALSFSSWSRSMLGDFCEGQVTCKNNGTRDEGEERI
jgi:hypothetical protein